MTCDDDQRNCRPPSCCNVDVMNGALGCDRYGLSSTLRTANSAGSRAGSQRGCRRLVEGDGVADEIAGRVEVLAGGDTSPVDGHERRTERRRRCRRQLDVPVAGGDEGDPFALTLDDEAHRRALHPPGRQPAVDPSPQHRGHLVAVQAVEDSAGLGGIDEAVVDAARVVHGVVDRRRRDLVEDHPLDRHLRLEVLEEVPADRFALAVLVRRQVQLAGVLQRGPQLLDDLGTALGQLVGRLEPVVDVDGQTLRRAGRRRGPPRRARRRCRRGTWRSSWPSPVTRRRPGVWP